MSFPNIAANLSNVQAEITRAALACGRDPGEILLVAVTKQFPSSVIEAALAAGQIEFGENRPEEAYEKFVSGVPYSIKPRLHLIGPVQSRKAKVAVACDPVLIHSVDRYKIAHRLSALATDQNRFLDVLFQINVSGEESKFGFDPDTLWAQLPDLLVLPGLRCRGLMTIPPYDPDPEKARPIFAALRQLQESCQRQYPAHDFSQLSIGMSHDFPVAIEEGATIVRIGAAIFGGRP